ncbi:MAG: hypothetical protein NTU53_11195 [Planctomycetota bacterium]|nr:hypothetical protein [Planctomycetota bacterium]
MPAPIIDFIKQQATVPVADLWKDAPENASSTYAAYWYKAAACLLLSGHISPKVDGHPNMTDATRMCKEANFNPYLLQRIAGFLTCAEVVKVKPSGDYGPGPSFAAFWRHEPKALMVIARQGVLTIVKERTGYQVWRPTDVSYSHLIEFLSVFFGCFQGLALREGELGGVFRRFSALPRHDLARAAKVMGVGVDDMRVGGWQNWLDEKGQTALISALHTAEWAYCTERKGVEWFIPSPMGLGMLGLGNVPPPLRLPTDLRVLPNHCIFAGAGLEMEQLTCFFRYCRVKRIDQVFEFQVDPRRLAEMPAKSLPGPALLAALKDAEPLPANVLAELNGTPKLGGVVSIRWCNALVKPQTPETIAAIQRHPKLKGYLEAGAPPGYLLIKSSSDPRSFIRRCEELGFEVQMLR